MCEQEIIESKITIENQAKKTTIQIMLTQNPSNKNKSRQKRIESHLAGMGSGPLDLRGSPAITALQKNGKN
jgi:hypothetical protein